MDDWVLASVLCVRSVKRMWNIGEGMFFTFLFMVLAYFGMFMKFLKTNFNIDPIGWMDSTFNSISNDEYSSWILAADIVKLNELSDDSFSVKCEDYIENLHRKNSNAIVANIFEEYGINDPENYMIRIIDEFGSLHKFIDGDIIPVSIPISNIGLDVESDDSSSDNGSDASCDDDEDVVNDDDSGDANGDDDVVNDDDSGDANGDEDSGDGDEASRIETVV